MIRCLGMQLSDVRLISVGFSRLVILALTEAKVTEEPETVRMVTEASPIPDLSLAKGVPLFESRSGI